MGTLENTFTAYCLICTSVSYQMTLIVFTSVHLIKLRTIKFGTVVLHLVVTSSAKWSLRCVNLLILLAIIPTTVSELLEWLRSTQQVFQERSYKSGLATVLLSAYKHYFEHSSNREQIAVSNILSSTTEINFQPEMKKLKVNEIHTSSHSMSTTAPNSFKVNNFHSKYSTNDYYY